MWEVYDSTKLDKMGAEQAYMGSFVTEKEALEYVRRNEHMFEGDWIISYCNFSRPLSATLAGYEE